MKLMNDFELCCKVTSYLREVFGFKPYVSECFNDLQMNRLKDIIEDISLYYQTNQKRIREAREFYCDLMSVVSQLASDNPKPLIVREGIVSICSILTEMMKRNKSDEKKIRLVSSSDRREWDGFI